MTADVPVEHDDDRSPSQVMDDYWVYARRHKGRYPRATARSGKWLLFIAQDESDDAWAAIKRATEDGRLGDTAKAATARPNALAISPHKKVMCVYTYDGDDRAAVGRVLRELRVLGFWGSLGWKPDAATRRGLYHGAGRRVCRYWSDDLEPDGEDLNWPRRWYAALR
jgi:plasmid stabilization system protein ParE